MRKRGAKVRHRNAMIPGLVAQSACPEYETRLRLAGSTLWAAQQLPLLGRRDQFGGWTLQAPQKWWGHKAEKETWFYIVGCDPRDIPALPIILGEASHVIQSRKRHDHRPHVTKAEREHTPLELAKWLVELARRCRPSVGLAA